MNNEPKKEHNWLQKLVGDYRVMTSYVLKEDGQWQQFMTTAYRRRK